MRGVLGTTADAAGASTLMGQALLGNAGLTGMNYAAGAIGVANTWVKVVDLPTSSKILGVGISASAAGQVLIGYGSTVAQQFTLASCFLPANGNSPWIPLPPPGLNMSLSSSLWVTSSVPNTLLLTYQYK
jgi:hypothetical protein